MGEERTTTIASQPENPTAAAGAQPRPANLERDSEEPSFFNDPKRLIQTFLAVVALVVGIYILFPNIVGLEGALSKIKNGNPAWIGVALVFNVLAFAAYVALFRAVVAEAEVHLRWSESYQITMAGLAATRLFSAGGAGGIVLTYWALKKAGMERRQSAARMVAFLVVLYAIYLLGLLIFGTLLRTGVLPGEAPFSMTVIPAAIAGAGILVGGLLAFVPSDFERRISAATSGRFGRIAEKLAKAPATFAQGVRSAIKILRHPSSGGLAVIGAIGFWAANIGILWASFQAFDVSVPVAVIVQGFCVGMLANLIPLPGGVGGVDAGLIGAFVLFGLPEAEVFVSVLSYRVIAFWLPIPPGIFAFFQLRRTVQRWGQEGREQQVGAAGQTAAPAEA